MKSVDKHFQSVLGLIDDNGRSSEWITSKISWMLSRVVTDEDTINGDNRNNFLSASGQACSQEWPTDMAKVAIKSEKLTPFGGIFSIMEQFDSKLSSVIDSTLGMRCRLYGYQYSEIIRSLMSVYFCGG